MHFRFQVAICCLLLLSQMGMAAPAKKKKAAQHPAPEPVQDAPPIPQPPPTPEQMPAVAPHVWMNNGMMVISAENSTMGDILNAVRKQTGAVLEVPPAMSSERVATKLGPGTPQSVMQQLFAGSKFDYIIVGAPGNPSALQRIIVTPRTAGGASMASNQAPPQNSYQPPPESTDVVDETPEPEPEPAPPEQPQVTPPTQAQPYSNQPKTPEQLLQELQRMQQQQQGRPDRPGGPPQPPEPQ